MKPTGGCGRISAGGAGLLREIERLPPHFKGRPGCRRWQPPPLSVAARPLTQRAVHRSRLHLSSGSETSLAESQAREGGSELWACAQGGTSIATRARGLQADAVHTLTHGSRCWDAGTHMVRSCPAGPVALRPYCVQLHVPRAHSREACPRGTCTQALPVCFPLASGHATPSGFLSTTRTAGPLCSYSPRGVPRALGGALAVLSPDIDSLCFISSKDAQWFLLSWTVTGRGKTTVKHLECTSDPCTCHVNSHMGRDGVDY